MKCHAGRKTGAGPGSGSFFQEADEKRRGARKARCGWRVNSDRAQSAHDVATAKKSCGGRIRAREFVRDCVQRLLDRTQ
jgi:hypothetical protein